MKFRSQLIELEQSVSSLAIMKFSVNFHKRQRACHPNRLYCVSSLRLNTLITSSYRCYLGNNYQIQDFAWPLSMSLARRNLIQDKTRLSLSIIGVALAVMMILVLKGFQTGFYRQITAYL